MLIKNLKEITKEDVVIAGGKGASLGEMIQLGIPIPPGFVILADSFDQFLKETDLDVEVDSILHTVNRREMHTVEHASEKIQQLILGAKMPEDIAQEISNEFQKLGTEFVAVRSSATAEDSNSAAWAGQLDSFLNTDKETLLLNVQKCWASLFTPRAIFYRFEQGLHSQKISVAVVVQKMVESEMSGIAFSVHPITEDENQLIIEAGFGLGEAIVSGQITPDSYVVEKEPRRIIDINVNERSQVLNESQILELSELVLEIEEHYGFPCDIEWAFEKDKWYITQSRPITTLEKKGYKKDEWIQRRYFTSFLMEESLGLLSQNRIYLLELGETYHHSIIVQGVGDFLLLSETEKVIEARKNKIQPKFNFIYKVNSFEEKIEQAMEKDFVYSAQELSGLFELMSEHLAYYGLAKKEAEKIFEDPKTSQKDKDYIEKWRNDTERWKAYGIFIERVSKQTHVDKEIIHYMLIDEIIKLVKGEALDLDEIKKRISSGWSIVETDGKISVYLKDMSPRIKKEEGEDLIIGQTGYSNGEIITGVVGEDILVAGKTHPDMIGEIQRSTAVITDEGGILSHAAITCRELKKPCFIGTKNATKVLHDGDLVEVDAENGMIRIIKKK